MWRALRRLIAANPMGVFLWSIITKWYLMVAVASLIVLFYVVKGLEKIGFIKYFTDSTVEVLDTSKAIAQNCTVKLGPNWDSLVNFWNCLSDPGQEDPDKEYIYEVNGKKYRMKVSDQEKILNEGLNKLIKKTEDGGNGDGTIPEPATPVNPYDTDNNTNTN